MSNKMSFIVLFNNPSSYSLEKLNETLLSLYNQTYSEIEIILVENINQNSLPLNFNFNNVENTTFIHLQQKYPNRANMINQGVSNATGNYIVLLLTDESHIILKSGAAQGFYFAMQRDDHAGLVYSDYELKSSTGVSEIHLLNWHDGRLRDNTDLGKVFCFRRSALDKFSGFDETLKFGELYDMRLKLDSEYSLKLISNRYNGSLYTIEESAKSHNVFDYLLKGKDFQLEMEKILTEHLKKIKAYLPPDFNYHSVSYDKNEENKFQKCIASVIIPVNNRPEFIQTSINSVLAQTVKNIEVIVVVNGGKEDSTIPKVLELMETNTSSCPIRLIVHDINNIGLSLNLGLQAAKGKYYVQLDSDDRLKSFAIEKIISEYEKDDKIGMVIGSYDVWEKQDDGSIVRCEDIPAVIHDEWTYENGRNNLLRINGAGAPRSFHIKVAKEMGYFSVNDEPYCRNYGEDYEMVLRISEKYKIGRVWDPIYDVIRHKGGTDHSIDRETIDRNDNAKDYMRLESLKRRHDLCKGL